MECVPQISIQDPSCAFNRDVVRLANRVKPPKLPGLKGSRYPPNKAPVESGFFLFIIFKVYKRSLSKDQSDVLWHADALRINHVHLSTTRYKRQNASHSYWHPWHRILPRHRQYPWKSRPFRIANRLFRIYNTTWSNSIDGTFCSTLSRGHSPTQTRE